jgi:hypothetical protein
MKSDIQLGSCTVSTSHISTDLDTQCMITIPQRLSALVDIASFSAKADA